MKKINSINSSKKHDPTDLWINVSLVFLVIVGLLGVLLRLQFVEPLGGINYKNFLHAHSHVAFLGWLFNIFYILILKDFLKVDLKKEKGFAFLFWLLQLSVVGMLITFPIQGYARESIIFSSIHMFLSFVFAYKVLVNPAFKQSDNFISKAFVKAGLIFMTISSLGPLALGPIMVLGYSNTIWYNLSIYFYLHFQYNGWFTFMVFGLFFLQMNSQSIAANKNSIRSLFWLLVISTVLGYSQSTLWTSPRSIVYATSFFAALCQWAAVLCFLKVIIKSKSSFHFNSWTSFLYYLALLSLIIKSILQFVSSFPAMAELAYQVRNFSIAYLHLILIGMITFFIFGYMGSKKTLDFSLWVNRLALVVLTFGFVMSQFLLIAQPLSVKFYAIPHYFVWLLIFSFLMSFAFILLLLGRIPIEAIILNHVKKPIKKTEQQ